MALNSSRCLHQLLESKCAIPRLVLHDAGIKLWASGLLGKHPTNSHIWYGVGITIFLWMKNLCDVMMASRNYE